MSKRYPGYLLREVYLKTGWFNMTFRYGKNTPIMVDPETHMAYFGFGRLTQLHKVDYALVN